MDLNPVWAPVVAALGASLLTMLGSWGLYQLQRRHTDRAAKRQGQFAAYLEVLSRSSTFALRSSALGDAMRFRSGIGEALSVTLWHSPVLDPLELYDWMDKDFRPLTDAWTQWPDPMRLVRLV
jgi:hypothetical protein